MPIDYFNIDCPEELEDEVFIIETAGEMPEVALAESFLDLGPIDKHWRKCLEAATARSYLGLIIRDLDPDNVGQSHFRGLARALANLQRLQAFLVKCDSEFPEGLVGDLGKRLEHYLQSEYQALENGRAFASAKADDVSELCNVLRLPPGRFSDILRRIDALPCLDCLALMQIQRLTEAEGQYKRRRQRRSKIIIEIIGTEGQVLQSITMPVFGPKDVEDPALLRRADLVWSLLKQPELPTPI